MAGISDQSCFSIGSVVVCTTCTNMKLEGEVLAFDPQTKMLILKSPATNGAPILNDIHVVNLDLCSDLFLKQEVTTSPGPPLSLNLETIKNRVKNQIDQKRTLVTSLKSGLPAEGQSLFRAIAKTIDQITWKGADIIVCGEVLISPPYKLENVRSTGNKSNPEDNRAVQHIRKIVEKHCKDQQASTANATGNSTSPGGTPPPTSSKE